MKATSRSASLLVVLAALAGCAGSTQEQPPSVTTTSAVVLTKASASHADEVDRAPAPPANPDAFTDDEILGLVATFNERGIDLAKIGYERATDARVKKLARLLANEHVKARDEEARVGERLAMRVAPSDRMRTMQEDGAQQIARISTLSGPAFDATWLRVEAELQRDGLALVDIQLIPSARIPEMRAHLAALRDELDHHLRDVSELQHALGRE